VNTISDLHKAAQVHLNQGRIDEARKACAALIAHDPNHADGHFLMGMAEDARGAVSVAIEHVKTAIAQQPRAEYFAHLGRLLSKIHLNDEAIAAAGRAADMKPADALTINTIGCIYSRVGRHETAIAFFERALAAQPDHAEFRFNLAASLGFLGRFDEAEAQYEKIIAAVPHFAKAHTALSLLRRQTPERNHIARLEALLTRTPPNLHLHIHYAVAKELEDIGNHDSAFHHLKAAGNLRKRDLGYSIDFDKAIFAALRLRFAEGAKDVSGHDSAEPIFVVGMPRTGTTLVDRIISSHPDVTSAGELQTFPLLVKRLTGTRSRFVLDAETIAASNNIDAQVLGRRYLEESRSQRANSTRFVDKMPLNFLYAGFIAEALPKAKIVCLRRNPMDTCWSNFKHLFATNFSYYNYSYDLLDTAAYYMEFDALMAHWGKVLPGRVLEIRYESLVENLEAEARRLIAHLDLSWNDACLNFHENDAAVATPSAAQVRRPIYKDAVGRWRRYAEHLEPVSAYFAANGIVTDGG
jgi:tetratricopeptide (TPR) repeat protein